MHMRAKTIWVRRRIQLRVLVEWLPKDVLLFSLEMIIGCLQHVFRLCYRFLLVRQPPTDGWLAGWLAGCLPAWLLPACLPACTSAQVS